MDTWIIKEFNKDNLQELSIFSGGQSGQGVFLGILWPRNLMDGVGAEGTQDILSFMEVGYRFLTLRLILIYILAGNELGITIDL